MHTNIRVDSAASVLSRIVCVSVCGGGGGGEGGGGDNQVYMHSYMHRVFISY